MIIYNDGSTLHNTNLERPRTDVRVLGILAALNAEQILQLNGESSASIDLRGPFVGTFLVEATLDGTNWITPLPFQNPITEAWVASATVAGAFIVPNIGAYRAIRVRCSAYTSGSATVSINASLGNQVVINKTLPTTTTLTTTAAVSTGATLTIPAGGAGLYQYITRLRISKYVGISLTAAATPAIVTTTNITGTPSFDFKTLGTLGDSEVIDIVFTANPLKSAVANTNTTVVAPVLTGAIWKITGFWYLGA